MRKRKRKRSACYGLAFIPCLIVEDYEEAEEEEIGGRTYFNSLLGRD